MARLAEALNPAPLLGQQRRSKAEEDRLHELYWNRAQLKKEFAALRKERYKLLDALTEEEGRSARVRQKLEFLEDVLADPDTAQNAVVYYTLRKIWMRCRQRLVALSGELRSQREAQRTKVARAKHLAEQQREQQRLAAEIATATQRIEACEQEIDRIGLELDAAGGMFGWVTRRKLTGELAAARETHEQALMERQGLEDARQVAASRKPPEFESLDVETRRAINCTVVAFAELLANHYRDCDVMDWLKVAQEKSVGSAHFGDPGQCQRMLGKLHDYQRAFEQKERAPGFARDLARMSKALRELAKFKDTDAGTPEADSLYTFGNAVLARDTWNVSHAMLK